MMEINGFQKYVEDAPSVLYIYNVKMIMVKYQLRSEFNVILASATYSWEDDIEETKGKVCHIIKDWSGSITETCRNFFFW